VWVQILQSHVRLRIGGEEISQEAAHVRQPDRIDRSDRQPGGHRLVNGTNFPFQIVITLHDDARAFQKPLAGWRD
jgi:hypothetical protein